MRRSSFIGARSTNGASRSITSAKGDGLLLVELPRQSACLGISASGFQNQQVAAHWDRRAAHFDEEFGHSIRTPAERAAWDRILDLVLAGQGVLRALDAGCGTGFLTFELAARGHRVTG